MPTILITGANRGLGLEFTKQYAADGWNIIAACREPQEAEALQKLAQANANIQIETLDVGVNASIKALADKLKGTVLDVLMNNAGIYNGGGDKNDNTQTFGSINAEAWGKLFRINTIAPVMIAEAFMPHLRHGKGRKVIFISSAMGSLSRDTSGVIAYRTSKAALNMAMRNVAQAVQSDGITVVSFHPGWVQTDMGGPQADITPEVSVRGMRKVIAGLKLEQTGSFFCYDGSIIPW